MKPPQSRGLRGRSAVGGPRETAGINDADRALLDFESAQPRDKEAAISVTFGHSWVRYEQRLLRLTRDQEAVAAYQAVCARALRVSRHSGLRALRQ